MLLQGGGVFSCAVVQHPERSADTATAGELVPLHEAYGQFTLS